MPACAPRPDAIPNAKAGGKATTATVSPENKFLKTISGPQELIVFLFTATAVEAAPLYIFWNPSVG
jgi:hypothetical protein